MCGIIGVVSFGSNVKNILKDGLKQLEYRGYDSAGFCMLDNKILRIVKKTGTVDEVSRMPEFNSLQGNIGIAHTRWATHGGVKDENAHPFTSKDMNIAVVHNGIINNYAELKSKLISEGVKFTSETDSETISHLISLNLNKGFKKAVLETANSLKGSFAFIALSNSGEIAVAKNESPACIGYSKHNFFFSSDVVPLTGKAEQISFLEDREICFYNGVLEFTDFEGKTKNKEFYPLKNNATEAQKGIYSHYTIKEIFEVPKSILNSSLVEEQVLEDICAKIKEAKKIILLGCGTSYHSCMYGEKKLRQLGLNAEAILASDYDDTLPTNALIIAVSQSGETADVLKLLKTVEKNNIIAIINRQNSTLHRNSSVTYLLNSGFEIGVASTKSYSAQITAFQLIASSIKGEAKQAKENIKESVKWLEENLSNLEKTAKSISLELTNKQSAFILGSGINYITAKETALKIKEISYLHAEALASGELKHGSLALVSEGFPIIIFVNQENNASISQVKSRGAKTYTISTANDSDFTIPEKYYELISAVPGQLIAYYTALYKNINPDKPKNLAKAVTVN